MESNKITAVAFDLDGTLYPNFRLYRRLLPLLFRHGRLLAAFGKTRGQIRREQERDPSAFNFYEYQARLTAQRLNAPFELVNKKIETLIYRGFEPHFLKIKLYPHVKELLAELRAASLKLGILSDFPLKTKLKNLGIADGWDAVICSEETGALKPAARPFLELAAALGCAPANILYVGNSYRYDVIGAGRAGMKTALITRRLSGRTGEPAPGQAGSAPYKKAPPDANPPDFAFNDYRHLRDFVLQ
jgi:putative hydrolase of the HAD superfamily